MLIKALAAAAGNFGGGYSIDNSLRFNDDDSAYLSRTPATAGNRKTFTWSGWVKRGNLGNKYLFTTTDASINDAMYLFFSGVDDLRYWDSKQGSRGIVLESNAVFRDVSGWYHIVLMVDREAATPADRAKLYVNGEELSYSATSYPNQDENSFVNATETHYISAAPIYFDGYMAEVNFIDGQALTPDDFGEISATTGEWSPIPYEGTYGTNGFYLPFDGTGLPQGFSGGGGLISVGLGSGGGGAGGAGGSYDDAVPSSNGGLGVSSSITGSSVARAGGGGAPSGGLGQAGGGNGGIVSSSSPTVGTDATANSGSGGGGGGILAASPFTRYAGGDGGSGIVILRYPVSGNGSATGGSETTISVSGVNYKVHTFTSSSTLSVSSGISDIEYVVIGGGGGGGAYGGGGGAGGYRSSVVGESSGGGQSAEPKISIVSGSYPVTVGAGGAGAPTASSPNSSAGQNGGISRFYTIECFGGGGGASGESQDSGKDGGSGGGGSPNADPATIGGSPLLPNDSSGNSNNWTENNLASTDYMIDTPTNNFATLNPLSGFGGGTFSEGNLSLNTTPAGNNVSTIAVSSGKWYFEGRVKLDNFYAVGITNEAGVAFSGSISASGSNSVGYWSGGGIYDQGGLVATVASYGTADVASAAVDMDSGNVKFYKNNVLVYTYTFGVSGAGITFDTLFAAVNGGGGASRSVDVNFGADSSFAGNKTRQVNTDENGIGDFYYEPPAGGYLALCSDNLPAAAIVQPQTQFNVVTWTGNGTSQAITGVGFQPDMVWIKVRSTNYDHQIHDSVRGAGLGLLTNSTAAELNYATVTSFDSDGFTVDASSYIGTNASGETFVAWCWKAGGTAVSNTDGSITSQVSANVDSGFSVVSYTGTGANATVGHGLSSAPEMMLVKDRDSTFTWRVYHASLANTQVLYLSGTDAATTETATWNSTSPTSTVLSLGTSGGTNGSSLNYIAYCFHSVEGFSKFGSYVGNGSDNGTFVYTGFKPAFVLVKRTDSTGNWVLKDTARDTDNPAGFTLLADVADAEYGTSNTSLDILSNGFKPRTTSALVNASGGTYIYMAFAEHPFNYATGR